MENNLDPISIASQFVGTDNREIFNKWFYMKPNVLSAYCGTFVSYCRSFGGLPLPNIGWQRGFASVPIAVKYFTEKGKITDKPVRNDVVFFDWSGSKKDFEHTGLFKEDCGDGINFISIEGNTSNPNNPNKGGQSNGGWVMEKKRNYSMAIFAHP